MRAATDDARQALAAPAPAGTADRARPGVADDGGGRVLTRRATAAVLLFAAACTADPAPRAAPTTPPVTTPATSTPPATEPAPPGDDDQTVSFVTPSGNIACEVTLEYVECSIGERGWEPPGTRCGAGLAVADVFDGRVTVGCGETGAELSSRQVSHGESVTVGGFTCAVAATGVTCRSGKSGRGFFLSRARYRVYD